jgi:uncharacterized membrane protein
MTAGEPRGRPDPVTQAVARLLGAGILASVSLVAVGVVLLAAAGLVPTRDHGSAADPAAIAADVVALRPAGLLWVGLLVTLALPTARVMLALLGFARAGDRRAAAVAAGVLCVLSVAFGVAVVTR